MATTNYLKIYSNDGSSLLFTSAMETITEDSGTVTSTGFTFTVNGESGSETYTYSGNKKFIGFATTANATEPEYAIGDTIDNLGGGISTLYIVEESPSGTTYEILYNDEVINTVEPGNKIEIHCAGDIMDHNIVVRPVKSGPTLISFTISGTSYQAEEEMTWAEFCDTAPDGYNINSIYQINDENRVENVFNECVVMKSTLAYVKGSDVIIANHAYIEYSGGGSD